MVAARLMLQCAMFIGGAISSTKEGGILEGGEVDYEYLEEEGVIEEKLTEEDRARQDEEKDRRLSVEKEEIFFDDGNETDIEIDTGVTAENVRMGLDLFKEWQEVYSSLPPHSAWNQQSPLSRRLAEEGRLVAIIAEMSGEQPAAEEGGTAVVVEAVRRAEEEEVRTVASSFCTQPVEECGEGERYRRIDGVCNNLGRPQVREGGGGAWSRWGRRGTSCSASSLTPTGTAGGSRGPLRIYRGLGRWEGGRGGGGTPRLVPGCTMSLGIQLVTPRGSTLHLTGDTPVTCNRSSSHLSGSTATS